MITRDKSHSSMPNLNAIMVVNVLDSGVLRSEKKGEGGGMPLLNVCLPLEKGWSQKEHHHFDDHNNLHWSHNLHSVDTST